MMCFDRLEVASRSLAQTFVVTYNFAPGSHLFILVSYVRATTKLFFHFHFLFGTGLLLCIRQAAILIQYDAENCFQYFQWFNVLCVVLQPFHCMTSFVFPSFLRCVTPFCRLYSYVYFFIYWMGRFSLWPTMLTVSSLPQTPTLCLYVTNLPSRLTRFLEVVHYCKENNRHCTLLNLMRQDQCIPELFFHSFLYDETF